MGGEIKLKDPSKYNFEPKKLLKELLRVFVELHRGNPPEVFAKAVAKDERSFDSKVFQRAATIAERESFLTPEDLCTFRELEEQASGAAEALQKFQADLGEIPDEFMDAFTGDMMVDPVTVPSSG